jgi:hypothetical protein
LQFSEIAALRDADRCNVTTLMSNCVKKVGKDQTGLTGIGAYAWGDYNEETPLNKSLENLFWSLFIGFFVSPDGEPKGKTGEFRENLIVPRQGKTPDGLTQWVKQCFIPFYDQLHRDYPYRKKYLLPVWYIAVMLRLILYSLWRVSLLLWRRTFQVKPSNKTNDESLEKGAVSNESGGGTLSHLPSNESDISNMTNASNTSEKSIKGSITEYSGSWIVRVTSIITTVVACLLPTVAISILAKVHSIGLILGLITLFTALFAIGLVLLSSSSSRVEIFTATAA